ncbi:hypothetical protein [Caulobacter sp. BP25]|uniref:hypothetical protein n=1 Tax=Caulobacter sp. BP25 TaxID=2048900 RepID=UPI000C12DC0E|nr:hypothetical protein [Caulobacter sp. BP25]PHY20488.1 hypothetical protein CSW59_07700 [Caulobacter sp. BP25]
MADYLLLMHDDAIGERAADWPLYLEQLSIKGRLRGGSAIGTGACFRKEGAPGPESGRLTGFIRIVADDLQDAETCLMGNPVYEAGGTVEIRLLPESE